ncbi:diacylglycerol kinase family protein [Candidatus Uhrbacteria bacterium]|nr:diacylglycerol kinase family protein [Candidatus Uhrbacteria bacterium]
MIHLRRLAKSFSHAIHGVVVVFQSEQNFRIQVAAAILVFFLALFFRVRYEEWIILLFLTGAVLILELVNSILERIVDTFKPRIHPVVKDIKDIMAAAVLIASVIAVMVGVIIFYSPVSLLIASW